jgi:hypothetical protein
MSSPPIELHKDIFTRCACVISMFGVHVFSEQGAPRVALQRDAATPPKSLHIIAFVSGISKSAPLSLPSRLRDCPHRYL